MCPSIQPAEAASAQPGAQQQGGAWQPPEAAGQLLRRVQGALAPLSCYDARTQVRCLAARELQVAGAIHGFLTAPPVCALLGQIAVPGCQDSLCCNRHRVQHQAPSG